MHCVPKSDGALVPTPPSEEHVGVPVDAQLFDVPLVPAMKLATETLELLFAMAPKTSSSACVVVAVAPLEGEELVPSAEVVLSSGALVSPVTENAWTRWLNGSLPPNQVTVIVEPEESVEAMACVEQMVVSEVEINDLDTSVL